MGHWYSWQWIIGVPCGAETIVPEGLQLVTVEADEPRHFLGRLIHHTEMGTYDSSGPLSIDAAHAMIADVAKLLVANGFSTAPQMWLTHDEA